MIAYDKIEWIILEPEFSKLRFYPTGINWVIDYVATVSFLIKLNSSLLGPI